MMELFSVELDDFVKDYDDLHWDVSFRGEEYPPRMMALGLKLAGTTLTLDENGPEKGK